jgi:maltooligosyltrehalose synthase
MNDSVVASEGSAANERAFDTIYAQFIGKHESFEELIDQCKRLIMQAAMASELSVLGHQLDRLSGRDADRAISRSTA